MSKSLVSVITPCFNGGEYIHRLLDSVLMQTYPNIEMFVVNDGSTDDTESVVTSYYSKFKEKNYTLKCINQHNQGLAAAVNSGLKLINGVYLIWPDSDDFYASPQAIEKMVAVLESKPEYAMVRCFAHLLDEVKLQKVGVLGGDRFIANRKQDLFEDCLFGTNGFWFGAGKYMLKTAVLFDYYPDRNIYQSNQRGGQNFQLMLPLLYNKKCFTIEEYLYNVVERKNSHSRLLSNNYDKVSKKYAEHKQTILITLDYIYDLPAPTKDKYKESINKKYLIKNIEILSVFRKREAIKKLVGFVFYRKEKIKYKELARIIYYLIFKNKTNQMR